MQHGWRYPKDGLVFIKCLKKCYADSMRQDGEIKFGTPKTWEEWEAKYGPGRGDIYEGTVAKCRADAGEGTCRRIKDRYKQYGEVYTVEKDGYIYFKIAEDMMFPTYCIYLARNADIDKVPQEPGRQTVTLTISKDYFNDLIDDGADEMTAVFLKGFNKEFENRVMTALKKLGIDEYNIIAESVKYTDIANGHSFDSICDSFKPASELFYKDTRFKEQKEFRVVVKSNSDAIRDMFSRAITIEKLNDLVLNQQDIGSYPEDGVFIVIDAVTGFEKD